MYDCIIVCFNIYPRRSRGRRREEMRRKRSRLLMISGRRREEIRRSRSEEESEGVGVRRRIIIK